ncbi:DOMON-like domain-containing protein [Sphingomonas soli]|uniref:DOMON-like domain-containing protein n=1 Tax=Sphingomonas soli TaxID=266127 RepID=UPI00082FA380|nr:DOMON-like domain-containing protein [Sphingomonas soli]
MELIPHPAFPPRAIENIEVEAAIARGRTVLRWRVAGDPLMPAIAAPAVRTDGLWQTNCFELFVKPVAGEAYFEFNFAPSGAWAAYALDGYRSGLKQAPLDPPVIERLADGVRVTVDMGGLPEGTWQVGLSAVIEEADGTKSYWALAHGGEQPDFHAPASFALTL